MWRLRPAIFIPPSKPRVPPADWPQRRSLDWLPTPLFPRRYDKGLFTAFDGNISAVEDVSKSLARSRRVQSADAM